jgi:TonB-linked SusC/RagA family outer membrane protein
MNQGSGSFFGRLLRNAVAFNPTRPIRNEDGSYNENADNNTENPVSIVQETNGDYDETRVKVFGSVEYSPVPGLNVEVQASHLTREGFEGYAETKQHVSSIQNGLNGYASRSTDQSQETILNLTADYSGSFLENHNYEILGGYTWKENYFESFFANNYDFPTDAVGYNNLSDGRAASRGQAFQDSYKERTNLIGYFARLNYNFANRYLLTASFRREGSSKFGTNNKWGEFPGLSLGWRIAQEPFMESVGFLDNLKLRFGFGVTGSAPTGAYPSLAPLTFGNNVLWNGQWVSTVQPSSNPNPDLKWEEKTEYNLGLDFAVLNNRISGSVDIYRRQTDDLIYPFTVPSPPFLYDTLLDNAGTIQNDGLEVALSAFPVQGNNFQWSSTATYSTNRNELVSLSNERFSLGNGYFDTGYTGGPIQQPTHRVQIGEEIGNFYGFKSIGVTEDGYWQIEGQNGELKSILDQDPDDKQIIGNGVPDYNVGWTNTLRYGNWDLSVTMRGSFGFQILNLRRMFYEAPTQVKGGNVLEGALDAPYGDRELSPNQSKQYVSYFIEDGDFWKIDNITLGYQFGLDQVGVLKRARIYATTDNFLTITGYSGFDPDVNFTGLAPGFDDKDRFPTSRRFTLGVSLTL